MMPQDMLFKQDPAVFPITGEIPALSCKFFIYNPRYVIE